MNRSLCSMAIAAALVVLAPSVAHAQAGDADRHLANGNKLLSDKNFNGAIAELEEAYRDHPSAPPLLGIAAASHALHDDGRAVDALRTVLTKYGPTLTPAQRAAVQADLAAFAPAPVANGAVAPAGFEGAAPLAAPPPPASEGRRSPALMITGISLSGAGLVAGVIGFAIIGAANKGVLGQCGDKTCDPGQQRLGGALLAGAGGAAIAVGVPLLVIGARKVSIAPGAPSSTAGASFIGSF